MKRKKGNKPPRAPVTLLSGVHIYPTSHLVLKLIMEIPFLFLGPDHIHDLPVFGEAGGAVSITF